MTMRRIFLRFGVSGHMLIAALLISLVTLMYYLTHGAKFSPPASVIEQMRHETATSSVKMGVLVHRACALPTLELDNAEIMKHFGKEIDVKCTAEKNWVDIDNGTFIITESAKKKHGIIECAFTSIIRGKDDFTWSFGKVIKPFRSGTRIPSDFFNVTCTASDKSKYVNVHEAISYQPKLHAVDPSKKLLPNSLGMNVLIIGLDSVSRMMWLRKMPQVHALIAGELGGVVLEGQNIVGDGTPAATFPMLTGKREEELPEARRKIKGAVPVDNFPFIWKEFKKLGYITEMAEDYSDVAMYTYRLRGFNTQPTDHFARPYFLETEQDYMSTPKPHCQGSEPNSILDFKWITDTYKMYPNKLKFMFNFLAEFTHSRGRVLYRHIDTELTKFIRKFKADGHLDNTILIVMSDHGCRFSELRETAQGKLEERLPYVSITLPKSFKNKHPKAFENLKKNARGLTTVHDMHETLLDIVNFRTDKKGDLINRGISLFREIPIERTCESAEIADHWCVCLNWTPRGVTDNMVKHIADETIKFFNNLLQPASEYCEELKLEKITKAHSMVPNDKVLKFKGSSDPDGRVGDFSDITKAKIVTYQISLTTSPNNGHFEISARHDTKLNKVIFDPHFVSRTNKYGEDPRCIMEKFPPLRMYCKCKAKYQ